MKLALFPWVHSIKGSIERIAELANGKEVQVDICKAEPNWKKYDGAILNNDFRPLPIPRISYLTGLAVRRALLKPGYTKGRIKVGDHRGVWTNCNTSRLALKGVGIRATCVYRPYPLKIQAAPAPLPEKLRVLWYWKPDWKYCESMDKEILEAMKAVANEGIEIWVISNKHKPVSGLPNHPRIKAIGRCNFVETLPQVRGMVRLTGDYDWGRSNFDVIGAGRWVFNLNAWEFESSDGIFQIPGPGGTHKCHAMSAPTIEKAVQQIIPLVKKGHDVKKIHKYAASHFREDVLRTNWQNQLKKGFS